MARLNKLFQRMIRENSNVVQTLDNVCCNKTFPNKNAKPKLPYSVRHTRIVGMDPWDGLDGLGLGPGLDLNYLCHDLNQGSVS